MRPSGAIWGLKAAGCVLALGLCGCVSGTLAQERWHEVIPSGALDQLVPGDSTLEDCLRELGAPLRVEELGEQTVLIWGWRDVRGFQVTVSVPLGENSANFSWTDEVQHLQGVVAILGPDQVLSLLRRGQLGEILPVKRRAPRLVVSD